LQLQDNFARQFHYVRLSLTERCNFKCQYCLPNGYQGSGCIGNELQVHEINNLVAALVEMGVWKIRLTGGEPTLRRDLREILQTIRAYPQIRELALTSNAYKLKSNLDDYIASGLTNLNISLDSLEREQFKNITGVDRFSEVQQSIEQALQSGLKKIKINAVLLRESALEKLDQFLDYVKTRDLSVRFIELMQTSDNGEYFQRNYVAATELKARLLTGGWQELSREDGAGPAVEFTHPDYVGKIGLIAPYSKDFCTNCNRLRFTHNGELRLCLFGDENYPLRHLLQSAAQKAQLQHEILNMLNSKPATHQLINFKTGNINNLSNVGG
jgi:cyclic pyranopterin phosphate synthase